MAETGRDGHGDNDYKETDGNSRCRHVSLEFQFT